MSGACFSRNAITRICERSEASAPVLHMQPTMTARWELPPSSWRIPERTGSAGPSPGYVFSRAVDNRPVAGSGVQQSVEVEEAAWIGDRLSPFDSGVLTSVVPSGFEAYARVLHPLDAQAHGQQPGRWIDVASWSGIGVVPGIDFPDIALPEHVPSGVEPWPGEAPQVGTLHPVYADALAAVLARHTSTPDRCWFCTWEGWGSVVFDDGPRVELPGRNYALFVGPLAALPSLMDAQDDHSPNLWWPDDRAWCVATEIDLAWTYVGGSAALISDVLANPRLEAQPASPNDNHHRRPPQWLAPVIEATRPPHCSTRARPRSTPGEEPYMRSCTSRTAGPTVICAYSADHPTDLRAAAGAGSQSMTPFAYDTT